MGKKFEWYVSSGYSVYAYLAGLRLDEIYKDYSSCANAFKVGREKIKEIFGEEVTTSPPSCAPISYGHVICLGAPVTFPDDSEPGVRPIYKSIDEGIEALKEEVDFSNNYLFKHYLGMWEYLKKEFPDEKVYFSGFGWEGPITTSVLLRGTDFYMDILEFPEKAKKFLSLVTESIIKFVYFTKKINSQPPVNSEGAGLCDDLSSLVSPSLWDEFVIPYWEKYYRGLTTGKRTIHVENLKPEHLSFLKKVNIAHYDPAISPALNPKIIRENIDIPFGWQLPSFQLRDMKKEDVQKWVCEMVAQGAGLLYYSMEEKISCQQDNPEKVKMFIQTCKEIEEREEMSKVQSKVDPLGALP